MQGISFKRQEYRNLKNKTQLIKHRRRHHHHHYHYCQVCFIVGLWAIQSVVLGPPGSNGSRLPHMACISRWTSHWLATPIISAQLLPQHIMLAGQNVG